VLLLLLLLQDIRPPKYYRILASSPFLDLHVGYLKGQVSKRLNSL